MSKVKQKPNPLEEEAENELRKRYYTSRELSVLFNLSMSTLASYRRRGTGPKYIMLGYRTYRYPKEEVVRYLDEMTRTSTSANWNYDLQA